MEFKHQMEGKQVISSDRIFASVISEGPTKLKLNATYNNLKENSPFVSELVGVIVKACHIVPKGVLCFFSSYNVLNYVKNCLIGKGYDDIEKLHKVLFEEPRRSNELQTFFNEYDSAIERPEEFGPKCTGALLLAGIDFADDKARCVICVGIPYPNFTDEMVVQKKSFNDQLSRTTNLLNGAEWYSTQAYRALNQALGRCLRHRLDWGAILLVDERFIQKANPKNPDSKKISKWVREELLVYSSFEKLTNALTKFVEKRMEESQNSQTTGSGISTSGDESHKSERVVMPMPTID